MATIAILLYKSSVLAQSPIVFMTDDVTGNTSELVRFDNGTQTFGVTHSPARYQGTTFLNGNVLVANFQTHTIDRFSPAGSFAGVFSTPSVNPVYLESDSALNVYTCSGSLANFAVAARLDSAGVETQLFSGSGQFHGIDADAAGNVYIGQLIGSTTRNLLKFAPNGALLNTTPLGFIGPSDIAIDEVGKRLFLADPNNNGVGIKIFDISGAAPVLMGSITTPLGAFVLGVHYAAESGNVFAIDSGVFDGNPRGFEFSPGGTLIAEYRPANIIQARDIVTFVPEPSSATLLFLAMVGLASKRRIARQA